MSGDDYKSTFKKKKKKVCVENIVRYELSFFLVPLRSGPYD